MTIYLSDKEAQRAGLVKTPRRRLGRDTRPGIPAAGRAPSTGLSTLILAAWNIEFRVGKGYRLYKSGVDTGWCVDEKAACLAAKLLS